MTDNPTIPQHSLAGSSLWSTQNSGTSNASTLGNESTKNTKILPQIVSVGAIGPIRQRLRFQTPPRVFLARTQVMGRIESLVTIQRTLAIIHDAAESCGVILDESTAQLITEVKYSSVSQC